MSRVAASLESDARGGPADGDLGLIEQDLDRMQEALASLDDGDLDAAERLAALSVGSPAGSAESSSASPPVGLEGSSSERSAEEVVVVRRVDSEAREPG